MSSATAIVLAIFLLLGNAFFVGAEFALVSARRTQIEPRAEAGSRMAKTTLKAMENISLVIGVNQLGITVCSLVLGAVGEPAIAHLVEPGLHAVHVPESLLHPISFVIALTIVVYLHVVLGEMIPKNIALAGPDRAALILGPPIWGIVTVLRPVIVVINAIASVILRLLGAKLTDEVSSTFTREEVAALVEESRGEGLLEADEYDRLAGALGFTEKTVGSVLMPPDDADDRTARIDRGRRRGAVRVHRLQPVPGGRRRREPARLPAHQGRAGARRAAPSASARGQVDPAVRSRRCRRPAPRRARDPAAPGRAHGPGRRRLDGAILGLATLEDVIEELVGEIRDAAHLEESGSGVSDR